MKTQSVLERVRVAAPCNARWEDMEGDERKRFCGQCRKNVFNFSAMTGLEVEALLRQTDGRICGRFYRRPDGRMLTTDCPAGVQRRRRNRLARFGSAFVAMVTFFLTGCSQRRETETKMGQVATPLMGDVCVPVPTETNLPVLMGRIAPPQTAAPMPIAPNEEK